MIIIGCVVAVAVIGAVAYFAFFRGKTAEPSAPSITTENVEEVSTPSDESLGENNEIAAEGTGSEIAEYIADASFMGIRYGATSDDVTSYGGRFETKEIVAKKDGWQLRIFFNDNPMYASAKVIGIEASKDMAGTEQTAAEACEQFDAIMKSKYEKRGEFFLTPKGCSIASGYEGTMMRVVYYFPHSPSKGAPVRKN